MDARAEAKARTREQLLEAARIAVREQGAPALSLRDVARQAGVVPSAVYRHFSSRDDLLTQLILDAYAHLAATLEEAETRSPSGRGQWSDVADVLRTWALTHRHEFQLLYGTPVPGYRAPQETVPAAARIAAVFVRSASRDLPQGYRAATEAAAPSAARDALHLQLAPMAERFGVGPRLLSQVLAQLAQLVGLLLLEFGGHFVGTADPADHLWAVTLEDQGGIAAHW